MSNDFSPDLNQEIESWRKIRNKFNSVLKENNDSKLFLTSFKEECNAAISSEKLLASKVEDLMKQLVSNNKLVSNYEKQKKKIDQLNFDIKSKEIYQYNREKEYQAEKQTLNNQIMVLRDNLRHQASTFKDEKELIVSGFLFQISELKDRICELKSEKSDDLNQLVIDYENKLLQNQEFCTKLQQESYNLTQKMKEKDIEILQLKNKLQKMEEIITIPRPKQNNDDLIVNENKTNVKPVKTLSLEADYKQIFENKSTYGTKTNEATATRNKIDNNSKNGTQLNVSFNKVNKKYSNKSLYKKPVISMKTDGNIAEKNNSNHNNRGNSFNDGCVYTINKNNLVSKVNENAGAISLLKFPNTSIKRTGRSSGLTKVVPEYLETLANPSCKRRLTDVDQPTTSTSEIKNENSGTNKRSKSKKRVLYSRSTMDVDTIDLPSDEDDIK